MTEDELMEHIRKLCKGLRLMAFHVADSRRSWGPGFPDLVIAGHHGVLFREAKSATGETTGDQDAWMWALSEAGMNVGLWRPADLASGRIGRELIAISHEVIRRKTRADDE